MVHATGRIIAVAEAFAQRLLRFAWPDQVSNTWLPAPGLLNENFYWLPVAPILTPLMPAWFPTLGAA